MQLGEDDPPRGLDQREVREGLGEVAQVPAGARVELLGVEAERRGDPQQPFHQVARALLLADDRQAGDQPEGADQEAALLAATGRRRSRRCGSAGRSRPRSGRRRSPARSRAGARRRRAGSRRSPPAGWRRRARRCRSAGAGRRLSLSAVGEDVLLDLLGGRAPRAPAARRRRASPRACAARSIATQHMSFEET